MKSVRDRTIIFTVIMVALCVPALGQVDMLKGQDSRTDFGIGVFVDDADGNQDWVREFDGRTFDLWGIESLQAFGYNGSSQYWLSARDLILGNEDVEFSYALENLLGVNLRTSALTHRLARTPATNPFLNEVVGGLVFFRDNDVLIPDPGDPAARIGIGFTGDTIVDLSPGEGFEMDRRENDFRLSLTPGHHQRYRLSAGWWQELEGGDRQLLFRARAENLDIPIFNRQRAGAGIPIDRSTDQSQLGWDFQVGNRTAVNYRHVSTEFTDNGTRPGGDLAEINPLDRLTRFNSKTNSNTFKARSRLTDRLYFAGSHTDRDRRNLTSVRPPGHIGEGLPLGAKIDMDSTNLALTYLATDALTLGVKWREFEQDNLVPPVFDEDDVALESPQNQALSRDVTSLDLSATYTGIARTFLKLGFERRDTDRRLNPIHPPHDGGEDGEFEHPFTRQPTESDIWRLGVRYHPDLRLNLSGNLELWNTDNPGYVGLPTDRTKINLNATYMVRDNLAFYGDFNRLQEKNEEVSIAFDDIPTATSSADFPDPDEDPEGFEAATEAYRAARQLAAGQGFDNDVDILTLGAWYAMNPRLTFDASFVQSNLDTETLWIMGTSPESLPHLLPSFVPYEADNDQLSFGATYVVNPRWRLYGRFLSSNSEGKTILPQSPSPGYPGTLSTWTPIDVAMNRWTLGFAYQVSPKDRVLLDFSIADWEDNIDSANDGHFSIWRLAWSTMY